MKTAARRYCGAAGFFTHTRLAQCRPSGPRPAALPGSGCADIAAWFRLPFGVGNVALVSLLWAVTATLLSDASESERRDRPAFELADG